MKIEDFTMVKKFIGPILFVLFIAYSILGKKIFFVFIVLAILFFIFKKFKKIADLNYVKDKAGVFIPNYNFNMQNIGFKIFSVFIAILLIWLFFASIVIVDAGYVGIYSLFGKVREDALMSGFHLVNPLAKITKMSVRTEEYTMSSLVTEGKKTGDDSISALTKEGLNVGLDITVLYHLDQAKAASIYKNVGLNFEEKIIRPEIRASIREVISNYSAKEIYSEKREEANGKIFDKLSGNLSGRDIIVEDVLLRNVALPSNLAQSIQEKLQAEQEAQKYDFILDKEKKEKLRKIIEAEGQRDSQKIINESLSTNYLYYQYIKELKDRQGTIYVPTNPSTGMPQFKELGN